MVALAAALAVLGWVSPALPQPRDLRRHSTNGARRILFPFVANALSVRVLDAALRLASAEDATLVPVFLARVPLHLPLDTPLPRQSDIAIGLQEAIENRAAAFGISVDSRIERGRDYRHAMRQTIDHERYDRIVVAAAAAGSPGFSPDDVAWLLETRRARSSSCVPTRTSSSCRARDTSADVPATARDRGRPAAPSGC